MNIVYLVVNYVPHQVLSIKNLITKKNAQILAFHKDGFSENLPAMHNFQTCPFQNSTRKEMLEQISQFNPDAMIVSGWNVPEYVWLSKKIKKLKNIPVIAMSDTPWYGTLRQKINCLISPFYLKKSFTHIWVAGIWQYDYARKLGFDNNAIIMNSLTANTSIFKQISIEKKNVNYPKNFLFVGKFDEGKGLRNLTMAWSQITDKRGWTFTLVGSGEMLVELQNSGNFILKKYMSQEQLINEMQNTGCFVLPSLKESWGVVLHEAAASGLPIICSEICGGAPHFVYHNFNGYRFESTNVEDLTSKLELIMNMSNKELLEFSARSRALSNSINPELQIASLMQYLDAR